jgi:nicotinamidase-related amidase
MRGVSLGERRAHIFRSVLVTTAWIHKVRNGPCLDKRPFSEKLPRFDAFEDVAVCAAGRITLIVTGLWTSMCIHFTVLRALRKERRVMGVRRCIT